MPKNLRLSKHRYDIPMHQHKLFEQMTLAISTIINHMPTCGCGRYYLDRKRPDPTCHLHAWLTNTEIQFIKNIHAEAALFKKEASQ